MSTNFPTSLETRPALPTGVAVPKASEASIAELLPFLHWLMDSVVALEAKVGVDSSAVSTSLDYKTQATRVTRTVRSEAFDLDGAATLDRVIARFPFAITITAARIVYEDATTGTVAAGSAKLGTTVNGGEIAAATAYENTKAVGTATAITLVAAAVAANAPIIVRHTPVAATQAGFAHVEIDYTID